MKSQVRVENQIQIRNRNLNDCGICGCLCAISIYLLYLRSVFLLDMNLVQKSRFWYGKICFFIQFVKTVHKFKIEVIKFQNNIPLFEKYLLFSLAFLIAISLYNNSFGIVLTIIFCNFQGMYLLVALLATLWVHHCFFYRHPTQFDRTW